MSDVLLSHWRFWAVWLVILAAGVLCVWRAK